ncbi:MAG: hypothetical protein ACXW1C_02265 [Gallionella sp.]
MLKTLAGVMMMVLAAGGWFYLDYLNKQEQAAALELRLTVEKNRAKAVAAEQARIAAQAAFTAQLNTDLVACQAAAQQANNDYLTSNQKPVARKAGQFTVAQNFIDTAAQTFSDANAVCQQQFEQHLAAGM